jgi:protein-tyrosine phosphatase
LESRSRRSKNRAERAIEKNAETLDAEESVLVRCGSGVERSPAIVALYLIRYWGLSPSDACGWIRSARRNVIEELEILPLTYDERTR